MVSKTIEVLATAGTIIAMYLLSIGLLSYGFIIGAFANLFWIHHGNSLKNGGIGIMIVNVILLFININGFGGLK